VLVLIDRESRGRPAAKSNVGALGLMQVMPISLREYNRHHAQKYSLDQLSSSPQVQVRVGIWILGKYVRDVAAYLRRRLGNVALDDLIRIADLWYATGPGNARPRLDRIKPVWDVIASTYPNWDRVGPAQLVWSRANEEGASWDLPAINGWLETAITENKQKTIGGAAIALVVVAIAWLYFSRKGKRDEV